MPRDDRNESPEHATAPVALLLIDLINELEFPGAEQLEPQALAIADRLAALKDEFRQRGWPVVYVNDNFGRWRSSFEELIEDILEDGKRGAELVRRLRPEPEDFFVLKPKHSGFHATPLAHLLDHLGVETLVLTGLQTDICVLFTAHDAHMREYRLWVPCDGSASENPADHEKALEMMQRTMKADLTAIREMDLAALAHELERVA